jgi:rhomboid family GlyGly-CTERM serine protease
MDSRRKTDFFIWIAVGLILALTAGLEFFGDPGRALLRYDRAAIAGGEIWRLLSGHFVHLGWSHVLLNGAGLLLIAYLVAAFFSLRQWVAIVSIVVVGTDLGFWFLEPQLNWYVGLSGLLHGLLVAGTIRGIRERLPEFWFLLAFLAGKLAYEQVLGPIPGSEDASGGNVVVAAHLYGAFSGALAGFVCSFRRSPEASI